MLSQLDKQYFSQFEFLFIVSMHLWEIGHAIDELCCYCCWPITHKQGRIHVKPSTLVS